MPFGSESSDSSSHPSQRDQTDDDSPSLASEIDREPSYLVGVIPARWSSTRFPGKPLHLIAGKPLVQHVWERCSRAEKLNALVIATDHEKIAEVAQSFGAKVVLTSPDHPSGTDRVAEVAHQIPRATHFINIQGDEPMIDPQLIDQLATKLILPGTEMVTAASPITEEADLHHEHIVKVVRAQDGRALYFSRSCIPFPRQPQALKSWLRHLGIYGYRRDILEKIVGFPPSPLEVCESLEQLRALEHGVRLDVEITEHRSPGVDTPEQALAVEKLILQTTF